MTDRPSQGPFLLPEIRAPEAHIGGRIAVLEALRDLPFPVARAYWIHGMHKGERRGGHAHRRLFQAVVAVAGAVQFELDDGTRRQVHVLDDPQKLLLVAPGLWRDFSALTEGATLLVLASAPYDEADYIRDREQFMSWVKGR